MKVPFIQERIYQYYVPNCNLRGKNFKSPFRKDANPSFCIKKLNVWYKWRDWGTGEHGNCFDLVAKLNGLDTKLNFNLILNIICKDLGLTYLFNVNEESIKKLIEINNNAKNIFAQAYNIKYDSKVKMKFKRKPFNQDEINYWKSEGMIHISSLNYFDIYSVSEAYVIVNDYVKNIYKYSEYKSIENSLDLKKLYFCFAYKYGTEYLKLYRPYHFDKWRSTVPHNLVCTKTLFGNDTLIITKAKKEQLHLFDISKYIIDKFDILPLNNESTFIDEFYNKIKHNYKKIILWLDSDNAGISQMKNLNQKYNIDYRYITFGKNITDVYSDNYNKMSTHNNIKNSLCIVKNIFL